ncbi:hypothetical protein ANANG_G00229220 [Anguilla anguilla]|uniref:Uncharacterized protein n=1 Tax=Anguilla anguilla TaxID=7936 RepID=A0A9D3LXQ6_ANGAN|nr:hypothetical protein ANANG_G00229220 [Anguilla anguilla]
MAVCRSDPLGLFSPDPEASSSVAMTAADSGKPPGRPQRDHQAGVGAPRSAGKERAQPLCLGARVHLGTWEDGRSPQGFSLLSQDGTPSPGHVMRFLGSSGAVRGLPVAERELGRRAAR